MHNRKADGQCTIDDLILDEARWARHADFVAHAKRVLANLLEDGIVSSSERTKFLRANPDKASYSGPTIEMLEGKCISITLHNEPA